MTKNYRPISNLSFLSRLIERVIANQLQLHLSFNALMSEYQSAYCKFLSSETALLRVQNDILVFRFWPFFCSSSQYFCRIRYYWSQYSTSSLKTLVWYYILCFVIVSHQSFSNCCSFQLKITTCFIRIWYSTRQRFRVFTLCTPSHSIVISMRIILKYIFHFPWTCIIRRIYYWVLH